MQSSPKYSERIDPADYGGRSGSSGGGTFGHEPHTVILYYRKLREIIAARQKNLFGNITRTGYPG